MDTTRIEALREAVQHNCDVSDARHARDASLCIYLLRLREHFRWSRGHALEAPLPADELGAWIDAQERRWERLVKADYRPLPLPSGAADPFDMERVNAVLAPHGLGYAAGFGVGLKPSFVLAELERCEERDGCRILRLGRELARDTAGAPAMAREQTIVLRRAAIRAMIWDEMGLAESRRMETAMARAAGSAARGDRLEALCAAQEELALLHELGEVAAGRLLGPRWEETLTALAGDRAEHVLRAVRDLLADCLRVLPAVCEQRNPLWLHLYAARLTGPRRALFPAFTEAYRRWLERPADWTPVKEAVHRGRAYWPETARNLLTRPVSWLQGRFRGAEGLHELAC